MEPTDQTQEENVSISDVKSQLDLPATASDLEVITILVNLVAVLQEKYEALLADAVAMEDAVANRDLQDFKDFIDDKSETYWKTQLIFNREAAINALTTIKNRAVASTATVSDDARIIPLRNRGQQARSTAKIMEATTETDRENPELVAAAAIRNRAHEIEKTDKVNFLTAFARAEKELTTIKG